MEKQSKPKRKTPKGKTIEIGGETFEISKRSVPIEPKEKIETKKLIKQLEKATKKAKIFPESKTE